MSTLVRFPIPASASPSASGSPSASEPTPPRSAACVAAADWLSDQARAAAFWRDLVLADGGDVDLVAALDVHASFLAEHAARAGAVDGPMHARIAGGAGDRGSR